MISPIPSNDREFRNSYTSFLLLQEWLDICAIQQQRIQLATKEVMNIKWPKNRRLIQINLFADIHFFLISTSNVQKIFSHLRVKLSHNSELVTIFKKYIKNLEKIGVLRDHLEHITDGRLDGKDKKGNPLKNPAMLGNITESGKYNFGREELDLEAAYKLIENLRKEILNWNESNYKFHLI